MSTELYKKYRPRTLDQVVGNAGTVAALGRMIAKGKLPHTILFSGPSGCGKTTLARIVRAEIGCADLDFAELNCSDFRGIDTVRDIRRTMALAPTGGGRCRAWLLDEVHQLSKDAQNAILKMLEDTPAHVWFLLCTTDPGKLLPTVRTRCSEMPVRPLSDEEALALLQDVSKRAKLDLKRSVLEDVAERSGGSARKALVLLEKVAAMGEGGSVAEAAAEEEERSEGVELCRALVKKEPWAKVAKILSKLAGEPENVRRAVLGYARAVLLGSPGGHHQAYAVICAFEEPLFNSGAAGLARAAFEAIFAK